MSMDGDTFSTEKGNETLIEYADMFGLTEKSGVEIEESEPQLSDMNPSFPAIGQGNHNFTTVGLARYVTAVANSGTCYNLTLLDKVTDRTGNLLKDYEAEVRNTIELPRSVLERSARRNAGRGGGENLLPGFPRRGGRQDRNGGRR